MMCEVIRLRPRLRVVSAREATFSSIERHAVKAMDKNQASLMCLNVLERFPDDEVSGAARRAFVELSEMAVDAPSDCEPFGPDDAA